MIMGHKVHPTVFRLGIIRDWASHWFSVSKYKQFLKEDVSIRNFLNKEFARSAAIEKVEIERSANLINVIINTARPGILIGRGGSSIEVMKQKIGSIVFKIRKNTKGFKMPEIRVEIREVRNPETFASLVAYEAANSIERRMPYRRVLKQSIAKVIENRGIKGVKMSVSGRLNGSEIARTEKLSKGRIPLHTLRADIDYFHTNAYTTYGVIGVKVWIYKGEVFNNSIREDKTKQ
jgi:small subunit ribosomal protein S3